MQHNQFDSVDNLFLSEETRNAFNALKEEREKEETNNTQSHNAISHAEAPAKSPPQNNHRSESLDTEDAQKDSDEILQTEPPQDHTDANDETTHKEKDVKEHKKQPKGSKNYLPVIILAAVCLLAGFYFARVHYFSRYFYKNTVINNMKVGLQTSDEIKTSIQDDIDDYMLKIIERDFHPEYLTAEDIDLKYQDDKAVDKLLEEQKPFLWLFEQKKLHNYTIDVHSDYDTELAKKQIGLLNCITSPDIIDPKDAYMKKDDSGKYVIVKEVAGNRLDEDKATSKILEFLDAGAEFISLDDMGCYISPSVLENDEELIQTVELMDKYLSIDISYKFGEDKERIKGSDIEQYIENNDGEITLNTDWISGLVDTWGDKYDTVGKPRNFKTHSGDEITIEDGGTYGRILNRKKTAKKLKKHILNGDQGAYDPVWEVKGGWTNGDLTDTYVEISISEQMLWIFKNGTPILEAQIVSGKNNPGRETIKGCYAITEKEENHKLNLLDGQGKLRTVNYWIAFNGNQGIHDASWRDDFGGNIYQSNGSNGSINISEDAAQVIYENINVGDAVVVY